MCKKKLKWNEKKKLIKTADEMCDAKKIPKN